MLDEEDEESKSDSEANEYESDFEKEDNILS